MDFSGLTSVSFDSFLFESPEGETEVEEEEEISFVEEDWGSEEEPLAAFDVNTDLSEKELQEERVNSFAKPLFDFSSLRKAYSRPFHFQTMEGLCLSGYGQASLLGFEVALVSNPLFTCR